MFKKLKKGRDKEGEWGKNDDKLIQAVEAGDIEKLQAALAKKGTSPIKMDPDGRVPLHLAAELGQFGCLDIMIQLGTTVAAADSQGCTVLHYAAMGGHTDCVQRLVQAGAPLNAKEVTGKTALHLAVLGGHSDCVKILLKARASVDTSEEFGRTALMMAAQLGNLTISKDLIEKGARVNDQDHLQRTSLMIACEHTHKDVVDLLVKRGARTDLIDAQGYDAAYYAEETADQDLKESLESAPSVATWDVKGADEADDEPKADSIDYVDHFDAKRCDSPIPITPRQQNGNLHQMTVSNQHVANTSPSSAKLAQHSKEIKEMEEENEVLYEELSKLTLDHKKSLEKMKSLEHQLQQASMGHGDNLRNQEFEEEFENMKRYLQMEKDKRTKAEAEVDVLKARLVSGGGSVTEDDTEVDSNWGDSDDDLFDLPGIGGSPVKVKPAKRMDTAHKVNGESTGLVAILRSQIVSLRQENEELKKKSNRNTPSEFDSSRVAELEDEVASLREELEDVEGRDVVSMDDYNELKETNRLEMAELNQNIKILMDEIANISQRLAVSTDENERLKRKIAQDGRKTPTPNHTSLSNLQNQYDDLLQQREDLKDSINKQSQVLSDQAIEYERLKGKHEEVVAENKQLVNALSEQTVNGTTSEESEVLSAENARLERMVAKQSKAIAQQSERGRRDKQKYAELVAERDQLRKEMKGRTNGSYDSLDKDSYDDLVDENHRLKHSIKMHEASLASSPDKSHCDQLTKENWRLQDEVRKQDDEMIQLRREVRNSQKNKSNGQTEKESTDSRILQEKIKRLEGDDLQRSEEARKFTELVAENLQLQNTVREQAELFESQLPASIGFSKKRYTELLTENRKLKAQLAKESPDRGMRSRSQDDLEVVRREVETLQQKVLESDSKYRHIVTVYRSHLLSAIQDSLDPKVKESLLKISKIRKGEEFV
ncbi:ankycorbin-like isoform X1 [Asterias rubens]|uniref:ankycorbin-like isoform X1 n=1 Tax=Asterias rubens TaxID=7604 RepID=UPI001455C935|nr:ankycorbin-like isoform X1 [Asterias rubens]XP_033634399.1 ankycorbin-like isoform X1 [Asterias rubens]